ncbi:MAG: S-layer homology domain-containing protein, partial [Clostridia bacterium]
MKRLISLLTVLALSVTLFVPALAETAVSDEGIGEETILEAGDAEFSTRGSWANDSSLPLPSGMPSWYTTSAGSSSRFEINLDPGTYEVSWWRLSHTERNDKAVELTISYNGKTETKTLSFEGADIAWEPLGSYYFSGDGNEFLEFARTADSTRDIVTRTGAVRLVKVGGEAAKESASSGGVAEQLLALTGVTEGITLSEGKAPGRAEFLKMAMSVVGVGAIAGTGEPMFKDVTADHPYYGIIAAAIDFGFIHGDEQGYFRPEDPITYQEAVKIAVSVLGYEARAVRAGGYPGGYLSVASTIGLLSRVDGQKGFDGKAAAMLLFNALRTEPVEMLYNDMTAAAADLTALEIYHNIYFETDVVTGIDGLSLTNQAAPTGNRVRIGEALFDDPAGLAAEYIGQNVTYYYKKTTTNELVLVHAGALNEVLDIEASQIVSVTVSGGKTVTVLYDDGSSFTKKASTVAEPQVVYNGQLLSAPYVEDDFKIDSGSLRFVSSRGSRAYNLLFVYDYDIYVVTSVNKDSETVYPKYRADVLNLSRSYVPEYKLINDKNGKALDLGDLNQWNVLNVLSRHSSQPSGPLTIRVTSKKVSGKLEMVSPEGVTIKGKTYKLADSFLPYAAGMTTADSGL